MRFPAACGLTSIELVTLTNIIQGPCFTISAYDFISVSLVRLRKLFQLLHSCKFLQVSLVINYDLPNNRELYIHRIGRSGRFGRKVCIPCPLFLPSSTWSKHCFSHSDNFCPSCNLNVDLLLLNLILAQVLITRTAVVICRVLPSTLLGVMTSGFCEI